MPQLLVSSGVSKAAPKLGRPPRLGRPSAGPFLQPLQSLLLPTGDWLSSQPRRDQGKSHRRVDRIRMTKPRPLGFEHPRLPAVRSVSELVGNVF